MKAEFERLQQEASQADEKGKMQAELAAAKAKAAMEDK